jgi:hypothetical protein
MQVIKLKEQGMSFRPPCKWRIDRASRQESILKSYD